MYCNIYIYIHIYMCGYGDCMNQNWVPYMAWSATNGPTSALSYFVGKLYHLVMTNS